MAETFEDYSHRNLNDPDEELFSTALIERLSASGELDFAESFPCIHTRISLSTSIGSSVYTLPDDVQSIRRITWKGKKLDPLTHRDFRGSFQSGTQIGTPYWYVFNNIGQNQIKLFPTPNEVLSAVTDDLFGSSISTTFIIDYWKVPDYITATLPVYFRRRLLKNYIMYKCLGNEGPGQNLKGSKYFKSRYSELKQLYGLLLNRLHNKPRKLILGSISSSGSGFPGSPVLPGDRYGQSVSTGE